MLSFRILFSSVILTLSLHATSGIERFHTVWDGSDIRKRFSIIAGKRSLSLVGESRPALDPYYIRFQPSGIEGDHLIETRMKCHTQSPQKYICEHDTTGVYRHATILYRYETHRRFDLRFRALEAQAPSGASESLIFRAYSDGHVVHLEYYHHGHIIPQLTERYPIAP